MCQIISIVSGKGGTGKSTITAAIAKELARLEKKVLAVDLDIGLRSLDLFLKLQDKIIFDLGDIMSERCSVSDAIVRHDKLEKLELICAPLVIDNSFNLTDMLTLVKEIAQDYDYCLLDLPSGMGLSMLATTSIADFALVVTVPDVVTLRDTQKIATQISKTGKTAKLIINYVTKNRLLLSKVNSLDEIIDMIGVPLIGVLAEDEWINAPMKYKRKSKTSLETMKIFAAIAARITGKYLPVVLKTL